MARKLVKSLFSRIKAQSRGPFWDNSFLFFLLFNLRWAQLYVSLVPYALSVNVFELRFSQRKNYVLRMMFEFQKELFLCNGKGFAWTLTSSYFLVILNIWPGHDWVGVQARLWGPLVINLHISSFCKYFVFYVIDLHIQYFAAQCWPPVSPIRFDYNSKLCSSFFFRAFYIFSS